MDKLELSRQEIDRIDREMAALFCRRMEAVRDIASYKRTHGLPILDSQREAEVLSQHLQAVSCELRDYYADYLQSVMDISKRFQAQANRKESALQVELGARSYDVIAERGCLSRASELLNLSRRVLIVTDDGVPAQYAAAVAAQCKEPLVVSVPQGESSKRFTSLQQLLKHMISHHMTRNDCVVAVGGGMAGDLAGLAASLYMRGVDFYNIPTTLLAQVDSSVGGKTAVNFDGIKNIAGTFYQPKRVLLDSDVLVTLPRRQLAAGLAEALKMAVTSDPELFIIFEQGDTFPRLDDIIRRSVAVKARVVAADERESGLRRVLNFGHTIGHAIESTHPELLHGECVALGMLPMCSETVRERLLPIYEKLHLPISCELDREAIKAYLEHDKKRTGANLLAVEAAEIGHFSVRPISIEELAERLSCIERGAETK